MRKAVLLLTAAIIASAAAGAESAVKIPLKSIEPLTIDSKPIALYPDDASKYTLGALIYRGGLELKSSHKNFGGWSGLRMLPDGQRLLAISDEGNWGVFDLIEKNDQLMAVNAGLIAPFRDETGTVLSTKFETDCESVELVPSANAVDISFEHHHRFLRYAWTPGAPIENMLNASGKPLHEDFSDFLATLPLNGGVEALAEKSGTFLAISEEGDVATTDGKGVGKAARMALSNGEVINFAIRLPTDYKATDAHWLSDGTLLVLERSFSLLGGLRAAVQHYDLSHISSGEMVDGITLAQWVPPASVDNMEGLAVVEKAGHTFLYMISDDNFSGLQRTLLMKFEWTNHVHG